MKEFIVAAVLAAVAVFVIGVLVEGTAQLVLSIVAVAIVAACMGIAGRRLRHE